MKLKCIGGPADDVWFEPPYLRLHDAVRIPSYQFESVLSPVGPDTPQLTTYEIYIYVIDCFNLAKDDKYYFLRHENLTNKQAVLHQFSKKCLQNYK